MTASFSVRALHAQGFSGFEAIRDIRMSRCSQVPTVPGVYVVLREANEAPAWLEISPGGWFKGKDPSVPVSTLKLNWVDGTPVVYIGKADQLQRRLRQYADFGAGKPVGHWGGRLIWQIRGSDDLDVAWLSDPTPLSTEAILIQSFVDEFGSMPFANLRR